MTALIKSVLFFLLIPCAAKTPAAKPHPLHVSTSDISYNAQAGKLETICTIFTDDFEVALNKQYGAKVDLQKTEMHTAMDALIKRYIADHLHISTNNQPLQINYLGYQIDHEATDIYIESTPIPSPKKVGVEVSLLHNIFDDQINIVHVTVGGVRKSGKIIFPDKKIEQNF